MLCVQGEAAVQTLGQGTHASGAALPGSARLLPSGLAGRVRLEGTTQSLSLDLAT